MVPILLESGVSSAPTVAQALSDVATLFNDAVGMISGQPIALAFIGVALAGAGLGLFRRVIRH